MNRVTKLYSCRVILITFITSFIVFFFSLFLYSFRRCTDSFHFQLFIFLFFFSLNDLKMKKCIALPFGTSRLHIKNDHSSLFSHLLLIIQWANSMQSPNYITFVSILLDFLLQLSDHLVTWRKENDQDLVVRAWRARCW